MTGQFGGEHRTKYALMGPVADVAPWVVGTAAIVLMRMFHNRMKAIDAALADFGGDES